MAIIVEHRILATNGNFKLVEMVLGRKALAYKLFQRQIVYHGYDRNELVCIHTNEADAEAWLATKGKNNV